MIIYKTIFPCNKCIVIKIQSYMTYTTSRRNTFNGPLKPYDKYIDTITRISRILKLQFTKYFRFINNWYLTYIICSNASIYFDFWYD